MSYQCCLPVCCTALVVKPKDFAILFFIKSKKEKRILARWLHMPETKSVHGDSWCLPSRSPNSVVMRPEEWQVLSFFMSLRVKDTSNIICLI